MSRLEALRRLPIWPFFLLSIAPSLAWIALDRSVWPWDQALYGHAAVELFATLLEHPLEWPARLFYVMRVQPPAIAWLGQVLVPAGRLAGAVDAALLLLMPLSLLAALGLTYRAALELTAQSHPSALELTGRDRPAALELVGRGRSAAILGVMALAAAPLTIGLSHQFFVEPLQTLAVAWMVHLAAVAPGRSRQRNGLELIAAGCFAMMVKATSPLYILGPAVLMAQAWLRGGTEEHFAASAERSVAGRFRRILALTFVSGLVVSTGWWYLRNGRLALEHLSGGSSLVARLYGPVSTLAGSILFWLEAFQRSFLPPWTGVVVVGALVVGLLGDRIRLARDARGPTAPMAPVPPLNPRSHGVVDRLPLLVALGGAHLLLVVAPLVWTHNREPRFLLPLLPYLALTITWMAQNIRLQWPMSVAGVALLLQWGWLHAIAFGLGDYNPHFSHWLTEIDTEGNEAQKLEWILQRTCSLETAGAANRTPGETANEVPGEGTANLVLADLPWLNVNSLAFATALSADETDDLCRFIHPAEGLALVLEGERPAIRYAIAVDPAVLSTSRDPSVRAAAASAASALELVRTGGRFLEETALPGHPAIRVFRRAQGTGSMPIRFPPAPVPHRP